MSRTPLFNEIARALRIARFCNDNRLSTADGLERVRETEIKDVSARQSRREWLSTVARAGAAGAAASVLSPGQRLFASRQRNPSIDVGIVGAGLAGLACADTLADSGVRATVYEAGTRVGGRCCVAARFLSGTGRRARRRVHRHAAQDDAAVRTQVRSCARGRLEGAGRRLLPLRRTSHPRNHGRR